MVDRIPDGVSGQHAGVPALPFERRGHAGLEWSILPVAEGLERIERSGWPAPRDATLRAHAEQLAVLHPVESPDVVLSWCEAVEPSMIERLVSESDRGNAVSLTSGLHGLADATWWSVAHAWHAYWVWALNGDDDWRTHLQPCPSAAGAEFADLLSLSNGWLQWDFQFHALAMALGADPDRAVAWRSDWNARRDGIERELDLVRVGDHTLLDVVVLRTIPPAFSIRRVDAASVQRIWQWFRAQRLSRLEPRR